MLLMQLVCCVRCTFVFVFLLVTGYTAIIRKKSIEKRGVVFGVVVDENFIRKKSTFKSGWLRLWLACW
jgi:hypothetical protein